MKKASLTDRLLKCCTLFITIALTLTSCKTYMEKIAKETRGSYEIRVKLRTDNTIHIEQKKHTIFENSINGEQLLLPGELKTVEITSKEGKTYLNGRPFETPILIYSTKDQLTRINDRSYFGRIKIYPGTTPLEVINYIPIETYLISVVPSEVPAYFEMEALKAQAIVARTYSYYFISRSRARSFDVDDTTAYQVYKGFQLFLKRKEIKKIIQAIRETESRIITYEGAPILAYFHANSGGRLTAGGNYFGERSDLPYLTAKPDPYSQDLPGYQWTAAFSLEEFLTALDLSDLPQWSNDSNGLVEKLITEKGELTPKEIRQKIGYSRLKSEKFQIELTDEKSILIRGWGYGHGVGMSQWGAQGMAKEGRLYYEIIDFYYPGTKITIY